MTDVGAVVGLAASPGEDTLLVTLASSRLLSLDIGRLDALRVLRFVDSSLLTATNFLGTNEHLFSSSANQRARSLRQWRFSPVACLLL